MGWLKLGIAVIIAFANAVLFLQSTQEPLKFRQILQIDVIAGQRTFASATQYIFHF